MRNLKLTTVIAIVEPAEPQMGGAGLLNCAKSESANPQGPFSHSNNERTVFGAFLAAYLLTRSERLAEVAVCEAIESWHPDEDIRALHRLTMEASLRIRRQQPERPDPAPTWMPRELRTVFELSQPLRDCLVMRILLRFRRETCSLLTNKDGPAVDRDTRLAVISLSAATYLSNACAAIHDRGASQECPRLT